MIITSFLLFIILHSFSHGLSISLPRLDEITLTTNEARDLTLNRYVIGENITIEIDESMSNYSLTNSNLSTAVSSQFNVSLSNSLSRAFTDSPKYVYGLIGTDTFFVINKFNFSDYQSLSLDSEGVSQCFTAVSYFESDFIIDCNLANRTQGFFLFTIIDETLTYRNGQISDVVFSRSCSERTLVRTENFILQYCPCDTAMNIATNLAYVFSYKDLEITYLTQLNQTSLNLEHVLCIQNLTDVPLLDGIDQVVLIDKQNGVLAINILNQSSDVEFQVGKPILLKTSEYRYLSKRTHNTSHYNLYSNTHFLFELENNYLYEVRIQGLNFETVNKYLLKNGTNIIAATLTEDFAVLLISQGGSTNLRAISRTSNLIFSEVSVDKSYTLNGTSNYELNEIYVLKNSDLAIVLEKIKFSEIKLILTCCKQHISDRVKQNIALKICKDSQHCDYNYLNFSVIPPNYFLPIHTSLTSFIADDEDIQINLKDLALGPAPQLSLSLPHIVENASLYLSKNLNYSGQINSTSSITVINDLYIAEFVYPYWYIDGEVLDILVIPRANVSTSSFLIVRCNFSGDTVETCSVLNTFNSQGGEIQQATYFQNVLYILFQKNATAFSFSLSDKQYTLAPQYNYNIPCIRISFDTMSTDDILCFSKNQFCSFSKQRGSLNFCYNITDGDITSVDDTFLSEKLLVATNGTHMVFYAKSNETSFDLLGSLWICASCNFQYFLYGNLIRKIMVLVSFDEQTITEYDITNPSHIFRTRAYPQYNATLVKAFKGQHTELIVVQVDNCCLNQEVGAALFIYNPELSTNQVLTEIIVQAELKDPNFYYTPGNDFDTLIAIKNNLLLYSTYKNPHIRFKISLEDQDSKDVKVMMNYSTINGLINDSRIQISFTVVPDILNFYIRTNRTQADMALDFSGEDTVPFDLPFLGPTKAYSIEYDNLVCDSQNANCPYTLRNFTQKYSFFTGYHQTITKYGYPIKIQTLNTLVVLLSQKNLNIIDTNINLEPVWTQDTTPFVSCVDLTIVDNNVYVLCQLLYQTFSILVKPLNQTGGNASNLTLPLQFQGLSKFVILNDLVFLLGNSTQTNSINDISVYQLQTNNQQIKHIGDLTKLYDELSSPYIEYFDVIQIPEVNQTDPNISIYGFFVIFDRRLKYVEIIVSYDAQNTSIQLSFLREIKLELLLKGENEEDKLAYVSAESFSITPDENDYLFNLLLGTTSNLYLTNVTLNSDDYNQTNTPDTIYKGYKNCLNYFGDDPKSVDDLTMSLCYNIVQDPLLAPLDHIYTLLVYDKRYNSVLPLQDNNTTNVLYPVAMISSNMAENSSSFGLYSKVENGETVKHIVLSNLISQYQDYIVHDQLSISKNMGFEHENSGIVVNLKAFNDYSQQSYPLSITTSEVAPDEDLFVLIYIILFGLSFLFIGLYLIKKHRKKRYNDANYDNYSLVLNPIMH